MAMQQREVDRILILRLRQIGCSFIDESIDRLGDFDPQLLFRCTVVLVKQICEHKAARLSSQQVPAVVESLPPDLPDDMATRFKTCSALVDIIRDDLSLPKKMELSFDVFLYPNELRTRELLGWLVEQLMDALNEEEGNKLKSIGVQKRQATLSVETLLEEQQQRQKQQQQQQKKSASGGGGGGGDGKMPLLLMADQDDGFDMDEDASLQDRIRHTLSRLVKSQWITTPARRMETMRHRRTRVETHTVHTVFTPQNEYEEAYLRKYASLVTEQVKNAEHIASSIIEDNAKCVAEEEVRASERNLHGEQQDHGGSRSLNFDQMRQERRQLIMNRASSNLRTAMQRSNDPNYQRRLRLQRRRQRRGLGDNAVVGDIDDSVAQVLSRLSKGGAKNFIDASTFTNRVQFETEQKEAPRREELDPEEEEARRMREIEKLQSMLDKINAAIELVRANIDALQNTINQTEENIQTERNAKKTVEDEFKLKKKTASMFQDKDTNIRHMEQLNAESAERLVQLAREWEQHRQPLVERYRSLKEELANRKANYVKKLEDIKKQREQVKSHIAEVRQKEQLIAQLQAEYEEMPKEATRESYVSKILDIVRNIEKQKSEIHKVMLESRELRRNTEALEEKLGRTFQETEALIFADANNPKVGALHQDTSKSMYRYLVQLNQLFEQVISHVQETGKAASAIRMLEHQIDHISRRNDSLNVERLEQDLQFIREQNKELLQQIRSLVSA